MSSYDIRPALRVDRLFQLLLATLADMAIEAIENSSWRRHLIHANRAFRSSWWLVGNVTGSEHAEFVEYCFIHEAILKSMDNYIQTTNYLLKD